MTNSNPADPEMTSSKETEAVLDGATEESAIPMKQRYGWGNCRAPCLQFLNRAAWLLVFVSMGNFVQVNSMGNFVQVNSMGNFVQVNSMGNFVQVNSMGNFVQVNSMGNFVQVNSMGNFVQVNSMGNFVQVNSMGNFVQVNSMGNFVQENSMGNFVQVNSMGNDVMRTHARARIPSYDPSILSEHVGQRFHRRVLLDSGETVPTDEQTELLDRQRLRLRHHPCRTALQLPGHQVSWTVCVSIPGVCLYAVVYTTNSN